MSVSNERLHFLLHAYLGNVITKEQSNELSELVADPASEKFIRDFMENYWSVMLIDNSISIDQEKVFESILVKRSVKSPDIEPKVLRLGNWRTIKYVASIFLVVSVGLTIYLSRKNSLKGEFAGKAIEMSQNAIGLQKKRTLLTLSDGSVIPLDSNLNGNSAHQGFSNFTNKNGQLVYHAMAGRFSPKAIMEMNTLTTPKGGEYQVTLHDGTKVWLNTASSITFPVVFNTSQRRVKIKGEAYLEVAKNPAMPFIVEANGSEVTVLGTHFNISAYPDDDFVKTTLLEGAVSVKSQKGSELLRPGQQAVMSTKSSLMEVSEVNANEVLAWKNGYFVFKGEDIKSIMRIISRWYDVDIVYKGDLRGRTFSGTISRFGSIDELLRTIELTEAVNFDIKGRKVTVMP